jgi:hypothetical protein
MKWDVTNNSSRIYKQSLRLQITFTWWNISFCKQN